MKAWLYYRLSRNEDEEMNSLQNQRQILLDYAEQYGYEVVGESFDGNVSGMTFNRKGLAELENAVDEGKIEVVLVNKRILSESRISDANFRMLMSGVTVHQNEDKPLDVQFKMNGDFSNNTTIILEPDFDETL